MEIQINSQTILEKRNKVGKFALPNFKNYYEIIIIKTEVIVLRYTNASLGQNNGSR